MDAFEIMSVWADAATPLCGGQPVGGAFLIVRCNPRVDAHVQGYRYYGVNGAVFRALHIAMGVVVALKLM
jgi:hypothetical protein